MSNSNKCSSRSDTENYNTTLKTSLKAVSRVCGRLFDVAGRFFSRTFTGFNTVNKQLSANSSVLIDKKKFICYKSISGVNGMSLIVF